MKKKVKKLVANIFHINLKEQGYILNINYNPLRHQKRILLCYMVEPLMVDMEKGNVFHPNRVREIVMLKALIELNFCIDVCDCNADDVLETLQDRNYDCIFGFGSVYEKMLEKNKIPHILYITENDPTVVSEKYKERCDYFKQRHPNDRLVKSHRIPFYSAKQIEISDVAFIMTNEYNASTILPYFKRYYWAYVNGMYNGEYKSNKRKMNIARNNFLWFGSTGLMQKGLDLLIDSFAELPELNLTVCGADSKEIKDIKRLLPPNVNIVDHKIRIYSDEFLNLVNSHAFIVSASCMEGMQSGIATCMMHGLIPIITKECGYHTCESIMNFPDYKVENIVRKIKEIIRMNDEELMNASQSAYEYSHKMFSLESFYNNFHTLIKQEFCC